MPPDLAPRSNARETAGVLMSLKSVALRGSSEELLYEQRGDHLLEEHRLVREAGRASIRRKICRASVKKTMKS